MAVEPRRKWNRTEFDAIRATFSPERIAEDEAFLAGIFKMADKCPALAEALAWAAQHDIQFVVDHKTRKTAGYYTLGTGVMAVSRYSNRNPVEVMTHELRHAWQDYHGMLPWDDSEKAEGRFSDAFISVALIEADAWAHGQLALAQYERATYGVRYQEDDKSILQKCFKGWFNDWYIDGFYGDFFAGRYGHKWGLTPGAAPEYDHEFRMPEPVCDGLDIHVLSDVRRLGEGFFGGANYLDDQPQRDFLIRRALNPGLADTFWGAARVSQKQLTTEIRKAALRSELAQPKVRHPWP